MGTPAQPDQDQFRFRRTAFNSSLKSKVGLIAAKAAALRINMNTESCLRDPKPNLLPQLGTTSQFIRAGRAEGASTCRACPANYGFVRWKRPHHQLHLRKGIYRVWLGCSWVHIVRWLWLLNISWLSQRHILRRRSNTQRQKEQGPGLGLGLGLGSVGSCREGATSPSDRVDCEAGRFVSGATACFSCPANGYSQAGASGCYCNQGYDGWGMDACSACSLGKLGETFAARKSLTLNCVDSQSQAPSCEVTFQPCDVDIQGS
jgi:hypothetical protein